MHPSPEIVKKTQLITPFELSDRNKRHDVAGNKSAFLSATRGTVSETEAGRFQE
jgi:hypothetical protein